MRVFVLSHQGTSPYASLVVLGRTVLAPAHVCTSNSTSPVSSASSLLRAPLQGENPPDYSFETLAGG